jgi:hypothetical protein
LTDRYEEFEPDKFYKTILLGELGDIKVYKDIHSTTGDTVLLGYKGARGDSEVIHCPRPTEEEMNKQRDAIIAYEQNHECCPECGGKHLCTTLLAYTGKDYNRTSCACGWVGIGDDLVPEVGK